MAPHIHSLNRDKFILYTSALIYCIYLYVSIYTQQVLLVYIGDTKIKKVKLREIIFCTFKLECENVEKENVNRNLQ